MANIVRKYTFTDGSVGYAGQMNEELDQLVSAVNNGDNSMTELSTKVGSSKIGSPALTDLGQTLDSNAWEQLLLIATAMVNRYTKAEVDALVTTINTNAVSTVVFDDATGSFTITKIDGTSTVIDTNIEKIPASLSLENREGSVFLVITNDDGTKSESDVTALLNMYKAVDTSTIDMTVEGYNISANLKSGSVLLSHLAAEVTSALEGYATTASAAAASAVDAKNTAVAASATAVEKATATEADASTTTANAATSTTNALLATSYAVGGTGTRAGEDTDNAKYYKEQAESFSPEGIMQKATYDSDGNGVVDDSEKLGGQLPAYYATKTENDAKIGNVVEDTSPQLSNELDCQDHTIGGTEYTNGASGTAKTIDWKSGNHQSITLTDNCTLTFINPSKPCMLSLRVVNDATDGRTLTLPTIKWANAEAPQWTAKANAIDILSLYFDGTNYYGQVGLNFA